MTWHAHLSSRRTNPAAPFLAEVLDGAGVLRARVSGSADYVCTLVAAMCERQSTDVGDLLPKPKPKALLYCIEGGRS